MPNQYTYRAEWSPEDDEFVGLVAEFPSLSHLAATPAEAVAGAVELVDGILADMAETGETPPTPFTERRYSGNLSVRTSPAQHRALTIEAAEQGVSVNQWVNHKLGRHAADRGAAWKALASAGGGDPRVTLRQIAAAANVPETTETARAVFDKIAPRNDFRTAFDQIAEQSISETTSAVRDVMRAALTAAQIERIQQTPGFTSMVEKATESLAEAMRSFHDAQRGSLAAALGSISEATAATIIGGPLSGSLELDDATKAKKS